MTDQSFINYYHPQAFLMYALSNKNNIKKSDLKVETEGVSVYKIGGKYEPTGVMSKIYNFQHTYKLNN